MKKLYSAILLLFTCSHFSCNKLVEIDPPLKEIGYEKTFTSDATAEAALLNIYGNLADQSSFTGGWVFGWSYYGGVVADDYIFYGSSDRITELYNNNVTPKSDVVRSMWSQAYNVIYMANSAIEGMTAATSLTPSVKTRLIAEARFVRAFCHFYLAAVFGDVPYITTTDYIQNALVSRMPVADVYAHIASELEEIKDMLPEDYMTSERIRPNKWTLVALQARTYLYSNQWAKAEQAATSIIDKTAMYSLPSPAVSFLKATKEAIWQFLPSYGLKSLYEGDLFILLSTPDYVSLTPSLVNAFEPGDTRRSNWVGTITVGSSTYYYPYKYKENYANASGGEYAVVFRLAEQYLIRAEARANQDKLTGSNSAESDINAIRDRAGLPNTMATTRDQLLDAIMQERRVELFSEYGHRWFDLTRTGRAGAVLSPTRPGWSETDRLLPIPLTEIMMNKNLTQNPGY